VETMPPDQLLELESNQLTRQITYVYERSPFYREKFSEVGLNPDHRFSRDELVKLPFTTKDDLRKTQSEAGGLGGHQCAPRESIVRIQGTSGTTGKMTVTGYTLNK